MGLFGTVVSVDTEENKAVIELSPGNTATVHLQAIGKAVEPSVAASTEATGTTVPDSPAGLDETPRPREDADGEGPEDQRPGNDRP